LSSVETPPPESPAPEPAAQRCPRCGAPLGEDQEWCLNCGAGVGTRIAGAPGWRVPFAIAGVLLLIAAIAIAIAIIQLADDTSEVPQKQLAAAPTPAPTVTPEATVTPAPTLPEASGESTPEPTATPEAPASAGAGDAKWPADQAGWTVVLASDSSESDARDKAKDFAADGIAGVGVLHSDDFSSLKSGFWVVFAGHYDSQSAASDALDGIDARDAYIRRIDPR
jgi:hypothetical protein